MDSLKARVFALALPAIGLFVSGPAVDATASETNQIPAVTDGVAVTSSEALLQSEADVASTPSLNFVRRMSAADFERARNAAQTEAAQEVDATTEQRHKEFAELLSGSKFVGSFTVLGQKNQKLCVTCCLWSCNCCCCLQVAEVDVTTVKAPQQQPQQQQQRRPLVVSA